MPTVHEHKIITFIEIESTSVDECDWINWFDSVLSFKILLDEIWFTLSTTVLECTCMVEFI